MNGFFRFIEKQYYSYCLKNKTPYFGRLMAALQGVPIRHAYMDLLVRDECQNREEPFHILEIGSWAGGSAITWANAIKKYNNRGGSVICVDPWRPYFDPIRYSDMNDGRENVYLEMEKALSTGEVFDLFLHNIESTKHDDIVIPLRGYSAEVLPLLGEKKFDLVFIDGDHTYENVLLDMKNSAPLVREGGILCGDDLELQGSQIDLEYARKNLDKDCISCPEMNIQFHPGVTLAVSDFLGEVSVIEGFWAMRKRGQDWERVKFAERELAEASIPEHVRYNSSPILLDKGYKGFNLFLYGKCCIALSQALGPVDILQLDEETFQEYQRRHLLIWAVSLEKVRNLIDQSPPMLLEGEYKGYAFLFSQGKCYALAKILIPGDLRLLSERTLNEYERQGLCIVERSISDLKHRIDDGYKLPMLQEVDDDYKGFYIVNYGGLYCALALPSPRLDKLSITGGDALKGHFWNGGCLVASEREEVKHLVDIAAEGEIGK